MDLSGRGPPRGGDHGIEYTVDEIRTAGVAEGLGQFHGLVKDHAKWHITVVKFLGGQSQDVAIGAGHP